MILSSNTNYDEDDLGDAYADESVIDQTHPVRRSKRRGEAGIKCRTENIAHTCSLSVNTDFNTAFHSQTSPQITSFTIVTSLAFIARIKIWQDIFL